MHPRRLPAPSSGIPLALAIAAWVTAALCLLLFNQSYDLEATIKQSLSMIDAAKEGRFLHYYQYVYDVAHSGGYGLPGDPDFYVASYSFFLYAIFALWNLPLYVIRGLTGGMNFFIIQTWSKILIAFVILASANLLRGIGRRILDNDQRANWLAFFFVSSPFTLFTALVFGQFDIFSVFFSLLAIHYLLRLRLVWFSFWFSLGISFKLYAVFIFIPLLLLREKRVTRLVPLLLLSGWGLLLERLLVAQDPYYQISVDFIRTTYQFAERLTHYGITLHNGVVFLFGIAFVLICTYAYRKPIDAPDADHQVFYVPAAIYLILLAFIHWHPQWFLITIPFILGAAFLRAADFRLAMYLQFLMFGFYLILTGLIFTTNVDMSMVNAGLLPQITGFRSLDIHLTFRNLMDRLNLSPGTYLTFLIGTMLSLIYVLYPRSGDWPIGSAAAATTPGTPANAADAISVPDGHDQPGAVWLTNRTVITSKDMLQLAIVNLAMIYVYIAPTILIYLRNYFRVHR